jgi:ubiquinone/menaquinone biosynthesis C-methylase UbiE
MAQHKPCPPWIGWLLASPVRAWFQKPERILGVRITPGMKVLDVGSAMGFFSLPLARMVGPEGRVLCVDVQEKMLRQLKRRARRAGLLDRLDPILSTPDSLTLDGRDGTVDFALAFAVVHEVPSPERLFTEIARALKLGGLLLVAEPARHVSAQEFGQTVTTAEAQGFAVVEHPRIPASHAVLLRKEGRGGRVES